MVAILTKSRVSNQIAKIYESNQYRITHYLNRIIQCLNRIVDAIQIAIQSNRVLLRNSLKNNL